MMIPPHAYPARVVAALGLLVLLMLLLLALVMPRWTSTTQVTIEVAPDPFVVSGAPDGTLQPGVVRRLNVAFHNPSPRAVLVTRLTVTVREVRAPRATARRPCTLDDYRVTPGRFGAVRLPAGTTLTLADAGIGRREWPSVVMRNTDHNQDGCKQAEVVLIYRTVLEDP